MVVSQQHFFIRRLEILSPPLQSNLTHLQAFPLPWRSWQRISLHWLDVVCVSVSLSAGRWCKFHMSHCNIKELQGCFRIHRHICNIWTGHASQGSSSVMKLYSLPSVEILMLWQEEKRGYYIYRFLSVADSLSLSDCNCKTIWVLTKYGWHKISVLLLIYKNVLIFNASTHRLPGELLQTDWNHNWNTSFPDWRCNYDSTEGKCILKIVFNCCSSRIT